MDQFLPPDAGSAPVAADTTAGIPAESQGVVDPQQGAEQAQTGAPTETSQPSQTQPVDTTDYRALYEQAAPRMQQYEQAMGELRQLAAQAQQDQQEHQARTASQQRIDRIYQVAETMPPEDMARYIRQSEEQERAGLYGQIQQIRQQAQQREYQVAATFAAPLYAQHLAQTNGLPPEAAQRLAMMPPQQMDAYVPALRAEYAQRAQMAQEHQQLLAQIDQLQRGQMANNVSQTGAHTGGGTGVPTGTNGAAAIEKGSNAHLLSIAGDLFGVR